VLKELLEFGSEWHKYLNFFLSKERLKQYMNVVNNKNDAIELYEWNIKLSEKFYGILCHFEIFFRNTCHEILKQRIGEKWYLNRTLLLGHNSRKGEKTIGKVEEAYNKFKNNKLGNKNISIKDTSPCDIISNLTLGFWVNLFSSNYHDNIWGKYFKHYLFFEKEQKQVFEDLRSINNIRNRIFHHEPIIFKYNLIEYWGLIEFVLEEIFADVIGTGTIVLSFHGECQKEYEMFRLLYIKYQDFLKEKNLARLLR
jgi:hypothetical protein